MDKSTRILTTALLVLLMAGPAMCAIDVTLATYDTNNDGVIDAEERITLDIDIESARIRISESMFMGGYTTTGTLLLNDEFQDFAFDSRQIDRRVAVEPPTPVDEQPVTVIETPEITPTAEEDEEPVATALPPASKSATPLLFGVGTILIVMAGTYMYYRNKRDPDETTGKR